MIGMGCECSGQTGLLARNEAFPPGALNMAAANARPTLGLFGASPPLLHDPLLEAAQASSMDAISVESVLQWVRGKLSATTAAA